MAQLRTPTTASQDVQAAEFFWEVGDALVIPGSGTTSLLDGASHPIFRLRPGSRVISASVEVVTALAGVSSPTLSIGDSGTPAKLGTTALAASAALTVAAPTTFVNDTIVAALTAGAGAGATAGAFVIRVLFVTPHTADKVTAS